MKITYYLVTKLTIILFDGQIIMTRLLFENIVIKLILINFNVLLSNSIYFDIFYINLKCLNEKQNYYN